MSTARHTGWDGEDACIAASILGVDTELGCSTVLKQWANTVLGWRNPTVAWMQLSAAVVAQIQDPIGGNTVVKIWSSTQDPNTLQRLACLQAIMTDNGAPAVQVPLHAWSRAWWLAMESRPSRPINPHHPFGSHLIAQGIVPWVRTAWKNREGLPRWDGDRSSKHRPHNPLYADLPTTAAWLDPLADTVLHNIHQAVSVIETQSWGPCHLDWSAKNLGQDEQGLVVYDWDSVVLAPIAVMIGRAAALYPATWRVLGPRIPTLDQSMDFVTATQPSFSQADRTLCNAAFWQARIYTARCEYAHGHIPWPGSARAMVALHQKQLPPIV